MVDSFRFEAFHNDILVYNAVTQKPLGFFVPPEDREWIYIYYQPEQIENLDGFPTLASIPFFGILPLNLDPKWEAMGFSVHEALNWIRDGKLRNPETIQRWKDCGFDCPEVIHPWLRYLVRPSPELAQELQEAGVKPEDVSRWYHESKITASDIVSWVKAGFDRREAKDWKYYKFSPQEAKNWRDKGFKADHASIWKSLGLSPEKIRSWLDLGFDAYAAEDWIVHVGITEAQEAEEWLASNLEISEIHLWRNAGYTAIEALEYRSRDVYEPPPKSL